MSQEMIAALLLLGIIAVCLIFLVDRKLTMRFIRKKGGRIVGNEVHWDTHWETGERIAPEPTTPPPSSSESSKSESSTQALAPNPVEEVKQIRYIRMRKNHG